MAGSVGPLDTTLVALVIEALVALIKLLKKPPFGASETKMEGYSSSRRRPPGVYVERCSIP